MNRGTQNSTKGLPTTQEITVALWPLTTMDICQVVRGLAFDADPAQNPFFSVTVTCMSCERSCVRCTDQRVSRRQQIACRRLRQTHLVKQNSPCGPHPPCPPKQHITHLITHYNMFSEACMFSYSQQAPKTARTANNSDNRAHRIHLNIDAARCTPAPETKDYGLFMKPKSTHVTAAAAAAANRRPKPCLFKLRALPGIEYPTACADNADRLRGGVQLPARHTCCCWCCCCRCRCCC
jgi:hypothetical protein